MLSFRETLGRAVVKGVFLRHKGRIRQERKRDIAYLLPVYSVNGFVGMRAERLCRQEAVFPEKGTLMNRYLWLCLVLCWLIDIAEAQEPAGSADLIVHHAKIVTVDAKFRIEEAVAIKDGRILAVGKEQAVLKHKGPSTRMIDAGGRSVLPGLYDSHVHPVGAALSELRQPLPVLKSLKDVFAFISAQAAKTPEGDWIVVRFAFPTRLDDARFPTKAELDTAAPKHPVLYHAGPAGIVNSLGLKVSGVTKDTPDPMSGVIVKGPDGQPTGMLRNAYGVLKGLPKEGEQATEIE